MRFAYRLLRRVVLVACFVGAGSSALAQSVDPLATTTEEENPGVSPPSKAEVHPPQLLEDVPPEYPTEALRDRLEAVVILELTIDAKGSVAEAKVIEPAGHGFDEAARHAAFRARYTPARRGDEAVASRVLSRIDFILPELPKTGALEGRLAHAGEHGQPAAGLAVIARNEQGNEARVTTDAEGAFTFDALLPGVWSLSVDPSDFGYIQIEAEIVAGAVAQLSAQLRLPKEQPLLEVTVQGLSPAEQLRQSAEAVTVVETDRAQRHSADLGEVLARSQGVGVQRSGGLGSGTRFSLNGLTDDQVRFFMDGLPLELVGYPFGIANVPVNLVERVEIYSGVVPVRFGADALGGAVNLATARLAAGTHASASYEAGSFDTHRVTIGAHHLDAPSGFFARFTGFFDYSKNDYAIDVEVPDDRGRLTPARVHRFHDRYRAQGAHAEVGVVDRPWAQRLVLRAFLTDYAKEYQHNVVMTVPYGGVSYAERSLGAHVRYEQPLGHGVRLDVAGGYAHTRGHFEDVAECVYDWFGSCVRERRVPGETDIRPHDQIYLDESGFARANLAWLIHPQHALRLEIAPTYLSRTGDELRQFDPDARDPLSAQRDLFSLVNGLEYEVDLFDDRLENIGFVKQYYQLSLSEEPLPGNVFRHRDRTTHRFGLGDGLRYRLSPGLYAKASYEWATRLPRADEVFGDNAFIVANLELSPETSHNFNLGPTLDLKDTALGSWRATAKGFLRQAQDLIVLLGDDRVQSYDNVLSARSLGVETALGWTSPGDYLVLDGNATYQDLRNTSSDGTFGDFKGDRIPNRPYLFGNVTARVQFRSVFSGVDEIALSYSGRYVHEYLRGWESVGLRRYKQTINSQFVHSVSFGYLTRKDDAHLSASLELANLTNEAVYDFFGVQRPGRAVYGKVTAEF